MLLFVKRGVGVENFRFTRLYGVFSVTLLTYSLLAVYGLSVRVGLLDDLPSTKSIYIISFSFYFFVNVAMSSDKGPL